MVSRGNAYQPYLIWAQVVAQTESHQHHFQKYQDLFLKDQIWAGKKHWEQCRSQIELTPFQDEMLKRGLREIHDQVSQLLGVAYCWGVPRGIVFGLGEVGVGTEGGRLSTRGFLAE